MLVHQDFYIIAGGSTLPSWATVMKDNKLETSLYVDWILLFLGNRALARDTVESFIFANI